jgi:hypothetical protein
MGGTLRGVAIVLFIVVLAGVIAYVGDRIGHQVGRKRLTLFNIRPRYTSTIIAVGTGMLIALIITLVAIFASNQVQTAFFRLNSIYAEIDKAQARARELEQKVTNSPVVFTLGQLMLPTAGRVGVNYPQTLRRDAVQQFYRQTVAYVNRTYTRPPFNLKGFEAPANVDKMVDSIADDPKMEAMVSQGDVLLLAVADQNLYPGDQIHFGINAVPDRLLVPSGQPIASVVIPAGKDANADLALAELLGTYVPREMYRHGMPPQFVSNVLPQSKMYPEMSEMRRMLIVGNGTYLMTAFAATDIYTHLFSVPVVITLQKAPS